MVLERTSSLSLPKIWSDFKGESGLQSVIFVFLLPAKDLPMILLGKNPWCSGIGMAVMAKRLQRATPVWLAKYALCLQFHPDSNHQRFDTEITYPRCIGTESTIL